MPFYPFLLDPSGFEQRFLDFLQYVTEAGIDPVLVERLQQSTFDDAAWYGLLFAVLALGCQFSEMEAKEKVLKTRVLGGLYLLLWGGGWLTTTSHMRFRVSSSRESLCATVCAFYTGLSHARVLGCLR